jgi:hypothetical protein
VNGDYVPSFETLQLPRHSYMIEVTVEDDGDVTIEYDNGRAYELRDAAEINLSSEEWHAIADARERVLRRTIR